MDCLTCEQLMAEFERAERRYTDARERFTEFSETSSARTYQAVKEFAEDARLEYEVSRIELERHQRTHAPALPESWEITRRGPDHTRAGIGRDKRYRVP